MKKNSGGISTYIIVLFSVLAALLIAVAIIIAPYAIEAIRDRLFYGLSPSTAMMIFIIVIVYLLMLLVFLAFLIERSKRRRRIITPDTEKYYGKYNSERSAVEDKIVLLTEQFALSQKRWDELYHLVVPSSNISGLNSGEIASNEFLEMYNVSPDDVKVDEKLVFVLTPFGDDFVDDFLAIRSACSECGFHAIRGDEDSVEGSILGNVIKMLSKSRLVIANINGRNANVFYELGIAHMMNKPTILVSQARGQREIPFDIAAQRVIFYDTTSQLQDTLRVALKKYSGVNEKIVYDELNDTTASRIGQKVMRIIDLYRDEPSKKGYVLDLLKPFFAADSKAFQIIMRNGEFRKTFVDKMGRKRLDLLEELLLENNNDNRSNIKRAAKR